MIIHFSILLLILIVSAFYEHQFRANKLRAIANGGVSSDYLGSIIPWLIVFGYITFLAGMRTSVNDTVEYRESFVSLVPSWNAVWDIVHSNIKDKGFSVLAILFKLYVSSDYHAWFLFVAFIESILFLSVLRRESVSFLDSCFLLFASTIYFNYFSMMRQWLAISIVFWASRYIKKGKIVPYIFFCLLAAQFHNSAYFMIFVYFLVIGETWNKKQLLFIVVFTVLLLFLQPILNTIGFLAEDSTYGYVVNTMKKGSGSSWIRIPIAAIPLVLAYIYKDRINKDEKMVNISVNISLLNMLLLVLASLTSGIFIGRMSGYTQIFSLILFPYLINVAIDEKIRSYVKLIFYIFYFAYYILQMNYSGAFSYGSDVIGYYMQ